MLRFPLSLSAPRPETDHRGEACTGRMKVGTDSSCITGPELVARSLGGVFAGLADRGGQSQINIFRHWSVILTIIRHARVTCPIRGKIGCCSMCTSWFITASIWDPPKPCPYSRRVVFLTCTCSDGLCGPHRHPGAGSQLPPPQALPDAACAGVGAAEGELSFSNSCSERSRAALPCSPRLELLSADEIPKTRTPLLCRVTNCFTAFCTPAGSEGWPLVCSSTELPRLRGTLDPAECPLIFS